MSANRDRLIGASRAVGRKIVVGLKLRRIIIAASALEAIGANAREIGERDGPDVSIVDHSRSCAGLCCSEQAIIDLTSR